MMVSVLGIVTDSIYITQKILHMRQISWCENACQDCGCVQVIEAGLMQVYLPHAAMFGYWGRLVGAQDGLTYNILFFMRVELATTGIFLICNILWWISHHPRHHPVFLSNQTEQHLLYRLASDQLLQPARNHTFDRHFHTKIFCCIWSTFGVI